MKIPDGPSGVPTLSASQFRMYGAGGFRLDDQEPVKGCPRLYKARYVEHRLPVEARPYALRYGSLLHSVLFLMEEEGLTPDEAMAKAFEPDMPQEMWTELRADIGAYLERGASPMDRFGTLAVEAELEALLYVDEVYGPVMYRGFLDWLGLDLEIPNVLHVVDYKSNRQPPKVADLLGDVQMRGYHWLAEQNAEQWFDGPVRVIVHLDAVKFREVEVAYTREQIEDWHSWAVAVARKILRDEEAPAILNDGCAWCPVRYDCPAFETLPTLGREIAEAGKTFVDPGQSALADPVQRLRWRDEANRARLLLEKAVKAADDEWKASAWREGRIVIGDQEFVLEPEFKDAIDMRGLHRALGSDTFYAIATTSKSKIEDVTKDWEPSAIAPVRQCIERVSNGQTVKRRKVE